MCRSAMTFLRILPSMPFIKMPALSQKQKFGSTKEVAAGLLYELQAAGQGIAQMKPDKKCPIFVSSTGDMYPSNVKFVTF